MGPPTQSPSVHVPPLPQFTTSHVAPALLPPLHVSWQSALPADGHVPPGQSLSPAQEKLSFEPPLQREQAIPWVVTHVPPGQSTSLAHWLFAFVPPPHRSFGHVPSGQSTSNKHGLFALIPPMQRSLANASVLGWRQKPQKTFDSAGRLSTDLRRVVPVVSWKAIGRVPRNFSGGGGQSCVVGYAVPRLAESPGVQAKPLFGPPLHLLVTVLQTGQGRIGTAHAAPTPVHSLSAWHGAFVSVQRLTLSSSHVPGAQEVSSTPVQGSPGWVPPLQRNTSRLPVR